MLVFSPFSWTPDTLTPANNSAGGAITLPAGMQNRTYQFRVANPSSGWMYVKFGAGAQTATPANFPIAPGSVEVFSLSGPQNWAVFGNGTIHGSAGDGA